jgi:hypothetical protein
MQKVFSLIVGVCLVLISSVSVHAARISWIDISR